MMSSETKSTNENEDQSRKSDVEGMFEGESKIFSGNVENSTAIIEISASLPKQLTQATNIDSNISPVLITHSPVSKSSVLLQSETSKENHCCGSDQYKQFPTNTVIELSPEFCQDKSEIITKVVEKSCIDNSKTGFKAEDLDKSKLSHCSDKYLSHSNTIESCPDKLVINNEINYYKTKKGSSLIYNNKYINDSLIKDCNVNSVLEFGVQTLSNSFVDCEINNDDEFNNAIRVEEISNCDTTLRKVENGETNKISCDNRFTYYEINKLVQAMKKEHDKKRGYRSRLKTRRNRRITVAQLVDFLNSQSRLKTVELPEKLTRENISLIMDIAESQLNCSGSEEVIVPVESVKKNVRPKLKDSDVKVPGKLNSAVSKNYDKTKLDSSKCFIEENIADLHISGTLQASKFIPNSLTSPDSYKPEVSQFPMFSTTPEPTIQTIQPKISYKNIKQKSNKDPKTTGLKDSLTRNPLKSNRVQRRILKFQSFSSECNPESLVLYTQSGQSQDPQNCERNLRPIIKKPLNSDLEQRKTLEYQQNCTKATRSSKRNIKKKCNINRNIFHQVLKTVNTIDVSIPFDSSINSLSEKHVPLPFTVNKRVGDACYSNKSLRQPKNAKKSNPELNLSTAYIGDKNILQTTHLIQNILQDDSSNFVLPSTQQDVPAENYLLELLVNDDSSNYVLPSIQQEVQAENHLLKLSISGINERTAFVINIISQLKTLPKSISIPLMQDIETLSNKNPPEEDTLIDSHENSSSEDDFDCSDIKIEETVIY